MNDHQCSGRCRREGCPNCPHGKGDEEHCDVCDAVTKAPEKMNYEHHSHLHCWENLAHPCNIKLEDHKQCCLCDLTFHYCTPKCNHKIAGKELTIATFDEVVESVNEYYDTLKESDEKPCCDRCKVYDDIVAHEIRWYCGEPSCPCHTPMNDSKCTCTPHHTRHAFSCKLFQPLVLCEHDGSVLCGNCWRRIPTGYEHMNDSKPQDWEIRFDSFWKNTIQHHYDLNFETGDERRVIDDLKSFIRSLIDSRDQEGVKARMSECCDKCDAFKDFGVCWNKLCPCHTPMNESKPQWVFDKEKFLKAAHEAQEAVANAKPQDWERQAMERLFLTYWPLAQSGNLDAYNLRTALVKANQEGVKAGEKRALEWVLKDVDLSSSSVEQIANRLDTPKNQ